MSEPDLIQQQRELLAGFRQATAERARAEADAEARRQREREAADAALRKAQQEAETQRAKALADAEARRKADRATAENVLSQAGRTGDRAVTETRQAWGKVRDSLAQGGLGDLLNAETRPTAPQPGADPAAQLSQAVAVATAARNNVQHNVAELLKWREAAVTRRNGLISLVIVGASVIILLVVLAAQSHQRAAEETRAVATRAAEETQVVATRVAEMIKAGLIVEVPAGDFLMGSTNANVSGDSDEKPQHKVYLDAFLMDRTEVTNAMYAKCVAAGACEAPSNMRSSTRSKYYYDIQYANSPVIYVSWDAAQAYCKWAGGRLPTEAEWEKAARGTDGRVYPWGNEEPNCDRLNYDNGRECIGDTTPVGAYPQGASPYGALDMAGNVWEWVADWYQADYYTNASAQNPQGPSSGQYRVLRGGSWKFSQPLVRAAYRHRYDSAYVGHDAGFRCARSP
jgi:formylglycine-generating enzyme required for sulfatase activity